MTERFYRSHVKLFTNVSLWSYITEVSQKHFFHIYMSEDLYLKNYSLCTLHHTVGTPECFREHFSCSEVLARGGAVLLMLKALADSSYTAILHRLRQPPNTQSSLLMLSRRFNISGVAQHGGLLTSASDWQLKVDLGSLNSWLAVVILEPALNLAHESKKVKSERFSTECWNNSPESLTQASRSRVFDFKFFTNDVSK